MVNNNLNPLNRVGGMIRDGVDGVRIQPRENQEPNGATKLGQQVYEETKRASGVPENLRNVLLGIQVMDTPENERVNAPEPVIPNIEGEDLNRGI